MSVSKGTLYIVATPIGNLDDMSSRAVQVLSSVDLIAAEDTRHSRPLLTHFGITTPTLAVHEHNERRVATDLLDRLQQGAAVALICDAGTPLVSDPGYVLVREAHARGIQVSPIPGPNAAVCALSASGLPTDRFVFEGFLPRAPGPRRARLQRLKGEGRTLIFYESGRRVLQTLQDMQAVFGGKRQAVLARELTKLHETLLSASLDALCQRVVSDPLQSKGEIALMVRGEDDRDQRQAAEAERVLGILVQEFPLKKAVALAATITGVKKNWLYRKALEWKSAD
jgi:16S rRNA (cytidine1402-2'-O)-methyltransferase